MLVWLLIGAIVCIVVIQVALQALEKKEPDIKDLAGGISDIIIGRICYEMACINMEYDHYTWIGELTAHEVLYYFMRYGGLIIMLIGVAVTLVCFYCKIKKRESEVSKPMGSTETVRTSEQEIVKYPHAAPTQQKVPAWKQVEMENQNK